MAVSYVPFLAAIFLVAQEEDESPVESGSDDGAEDSDQEHWDPSHHSMDSKVHTSMRKVTNKQMEGIARGKDRSDRATVETVLDPRTRMVKPSELFKRSVNMARTCQTEYYKTAEAGNCMYECPSRVLAC